MNYIHISYVFSEIIFRDAIFIFNDNKECKRFQFNTVLKEDFILCEAKAEDKNHCFTFMLNLYEYPDKPDKISIDYQFSNFDKTNNSKMIFAFDNSQNIDIDTLNNMDHDMLYSFLKNIMIENNKIKDEKKNES